jgi:cytochrome c peroxidase
MKVLKYIVFSIIFIQSCTKDSKIDNKNEGIVWDKTPYIIQYPSFLADVSNQVKSPDDNPLTKAGVELGRKLFYEPMLSANNTQSCATCHNPANAFSDNVQFSKGAFGSLGLRNAMPLFNLAFQESKAVDTIHRFFWDGSSINLERQTLGPIENKLEMASDLKTIVPKLQANPIYPPLFKKAFGTDSIYLYLVQRALAQFERTLLSFNSKYDEFLKTRNFNVFNEQEKRGYNLFYSENNPVLSIKGADCFHCHGQKYSFYLTDFQFHNNGLQKYPTDSGLYRITNLYNDIGKFKTPSLRNLAFTAPYMHDGSRKTLKDVINFYDSGGYSSPWVDPNIGKHQKPNSQWGVGLGLTEEQKDDLIAFLLTMSDSNFVKNEKFAKPN